MEEVTEIVNNKTTPKKKTRGKYNIQVTKEQLEARKKRDNENRKKYNKQNYDPSKKKVYYGIKKDVMKAKSLERYYMNNYGVKTKAEKKQKELEEKLNQEKDEREFEEELDKMEPDPIGWIDVEFEENNI